MAIDLEAIYIALFISSIFLMAISMPKIILITLWSIYRNLCFIPPKESGWRMKVLRMYISEEQIRELTDPDKRSSRLVEEMKNYTSEVKEPLIELISALIFFLISSSQLIVEPSATAIISLLGNILLAVVIFSVIYVGIILHKLAKIRNANPQIA